MSDVRSLTPKYLTTSLSREFSGTVRQRGADYFRTGRVRIESGSAWRVVANVRGAALYTVELERTSDGILASCTCPYFNSAMCKHIWAVILAAEEKGQLHGDGDESELQLVHAWMDDDDAEDDVDDQGFFEKAPDHREQARSQPVPAPRRTTAASWREQLAQLNPASSRKAVHEGQPWPSSRELLYVIDVATTSAGRSLDLEILLRDLKKDGSWSKPKAKNLPQDLLGRLPDANDRYILTLLTGATQLHDFSGSDSYYYNFTLPFRYRLLAPQQELLLPALCRTGRCHLRLRQDDEQQRWLPMAWDEAREPWQFRLEVRHSEESKRYEVIGALWRGPERMDVSALSLVTDAILFTREHAARYEPPGSFNWIQLLRDHGPLLVPVQQRDAFLGELLLQPQLPPLDLPEELRYEEIACTPHPQLTVKRATNTWQGDRLQGELTFDYDGTFIGYSEPSRGVLQAAQRRVLMRDLAAERAAEERLLQLGWRRGPPSYLNSELTFELAAKRLPSVVRELTAAGWHVQAEGKIYRAPGKLDMQVRSGIDWFELHGTIAFGDTLARLPELLAAARRGDNMVKLSDGAFGLLPQGWLEKYGLLAGLGAEHEDHLRFKRSQVGLLDALLAAQPESSCDTLFAQAREELQHFAGVQPADPPAGFIGELRQYQKEGLGWLNFLRRFNFGGCLADDMGLGKTVQVLALLEARREFRQQRQEHTTGDPPPAGPSLVVMPKSLIFNWKQEIARFAPRLRVLDHTGHARRKGTGHFEDYDVILTTYGTLRNDAVEFKDVRFDYVILDEAQAIKNATSVSAKAARLLQADHRLALSGTPVENHLGELWSLFEFLNPGMLGAAAVFKMTDTTARTLDEETRKILAQALRPFLLRRTKQQVVQDLPPKVEQTLYCELDSKQRHLYDELRAHYRKALLPRIAREGMAKSKIQILEALLRLRQAALHPGLLEQRRTGEPSAKLDMLLPQLQEVFEEGHKTLVFSQFTGMLAILREHLDRQGLAYEYLDGRTRNRQACVERFQTDPECKLFLISLKAGGVGLNLTAAQYVFLLDPWWNPAVEAQAIDRAHRIGQANRVFAYRLIARDTIEEKVLQLQNAKRDLADAIIGADNNLVRTLGKEDLELLLS
jgi:superfamily II DNA or RNA helicase